MSHVDDLKTGTHDDLKTLATKHSSFEDFMHDLELLGEKLWHNSRAQSQAGTLKTDDSEGAEPASDVPDSDDGGPVSTPAEPASPVSDGGFPTTNVDVVEAPVTVVPPGESQPTG